MFYKLYTQFESFCFDKKSDALKAFDFQKSLGETPELFCVTNGEIGSFIKII